MHLILDTETTGRTHFRLPDNHELQPHLVQVGLILYGDDKRIRGELNAIIKPDGWTIPDEAAQVHGITQEIAEKFGIPLRTVLSAVKHFFNAAEVVSSFNWEFDGLVLRANYSRIEQSLPELKSFCTMQASTGLCKIPSPYREGEYKWPKLSEAHQHFFNCGFEGTHDAMADVRAAARIYFHLQEAGLTHQI